MICGDLKLILKGPILIPGIPDISGDVLDEETIRKAALTISRNGILIDVQHKLRTVGRLLELYVLDSPYQFQGNNYPKGTLFCSVEVTEEEIMEALRKGLYKGFSIMAAPKLSVEEMDRGLN